MIRDRFIRNVLPVLGAAALLAACSSNAGFGGSPPYPGGQGATQPPLTQSQGGTPQPGDSPAPTPTPNTPLLVDSATARFAYDGSAADPVKAPRLVELTFALNNPQASPMPVTNVAITADSNAPVNVPLSLQALPNQDTVETLIAVAPPKDYSKTKQITLTFGDAKGPMLASDTVEFPTGIDIAMTPLDKSHASGGLSIDDVSISSIQAPGGAPFHYDVTFTVTNAGTAKAGIASFTITPAKGDPVKVAIPVQLPARTGTAPLSIVVPYVDSKAKALPSGKYSIAASDTSGIIAQGNGPLL